jgi:putative transposase
MWIDRSSLVWNDRHLHWVLTEYVRHYNTARPHRGLGLDLPVPAPPADLGSEQIERNDVLGGLNLDTSRRLRDAG